LAFLAILPPSSGLNTSNYRHASVGNELRDLIFIVPKNASDLNSTVNSTYKSIHAFLVRRVLTHFQTRPILNLASRHEDTEMSQNIPTSPSPLAVGPETAALMTGQSRCAIYRAIAAGELIAFKAGKRRLMLVKELEAWINRVAKEHTR
jgi:hypothetical protein